MKKFFLSLLLSGLLFFGVFIISSNMRSVAMSASPEMEEKLDKILKNQELMLDYLKFIKARSRG